MNTLHIGLGAAAGLAWIPVLLFFFRNFRARKNPISLAIGTLIVLSMLYVGPMVYWISTQSANPDWVLATFDVLSLVAAGHFYLAIRWSRRWFENTRCCAHSAAEE